jgi:hypothetical protein
MIGMNAKNQPIRNVQYILVGQQKIYGATKAVRSSAI